MVDLHFIDISSYDKGDLSPQLTLDPDLASRNMEFGWWLCGFG